MAKNGLTVLILSRKRSDTISSHKLFPNAVLVCVESEKEAYKHTGLDIECIPEEISGLGNIRNWCLKKFSEETILMVDDDVRYLYCIAHEKGFKITDTEYIYQVVMNTAICAKDSGTALFGFNQNWDVRKHRENEPFSLNSWVGGVVGIIGRDIWFDETNKLKVDIDFSLQVLLKKRFVWVENRFSFVQSRNNNIGGNAFLRTEKRHKAEIEYLKKKWGKYLDIKQSKAGEKVSIKVKRQQRIEV